MVITIIGLLLALLLSALRKARQSAQALLCMSQEKQIGLMVATYIHNHTTGIIPPAQDLELVHRTVYQMWTGILIEEILGYSATEQNRRIIKAQADGDNAFPIFYCPTMVEEGFTGNSTLPPGCIRITWRIGTSSSSMNGSFRGASTNFWSRTEPRS